MNGGNHFQRHHGVLKKSAQELAIGQRSAVSGKAGNEKGRIVLSFADNKAERIVRQRRRKMIGSVHINERRDVHLLVTDMRQAGFIAARAEKEAGKGAAGVKRCFELLLGRKPTPNELKASLAVSEKRGLKFVARALINSNEFAFIP